MKNGHVVSIRIYEETDLDRIYQAWVVANGWRDTDFLSAAIMALDTGEVPHLDSIEKTTLDKLAQMVERLETVASSLQHGGILTGEQRQGISDAVVNELPDEIKKSLRKMRRPGLTLE